MGIQCIYTVSYILMIYVVYTVNLIPLPIGNRESINMDRESGINKFNRESGINKLDRESGIGNGFETQINMPG